MIHHFMTAIALIFVFEGIFPFICPDGFRQIVAKIATLNDLSLRIISLISMVLGVLLLYSIHVGF